MRRMTGASSLKSHAVRELPLLTYVLLKQSAGTHLELDLIDRGRKGDNSNPLLLRLDRMGGPETSDYRELSFGDPRGVPARRDIVAEGERVSHPVLLLAGIACRYKMMDEGRRAIIGFLVPGDPVSPWFLGEQRVDFSACALSPCEVVEISLLASRTGAHAQLVRALSRCDLVDGAIQRMWLANIGQPADKRLAHLLCELHVRLALVGMAAENSFPLLMTQQDLADALGLSSVHVNRVMQYLREEGLIHIANRSVYIPDPKRLEKFAAFDSAYLHLRRAA